MVSIFEISNITMTVAVILGSAWVTVERGFTDGLYFMLMGVIAVALLKMEEHRVRLEDYRNGRIKSM